MKRVITYHFFGVVLAVLFLLSSNYTNAQAWTLDVVGSVKKEETKKRFEGVTVTVKRNGSPWKTITSPASGKFELSLPPDGIYLIEFSKFGHVSKKIEFSTKNVPPEDAKYGFEFPMEMTLFQKMEGLDVSVLNQPIAKVEFDPSTGYMDFDPAYTKSIQKELDRLKKELAERLKEEESNRKQKQKDYDAAIMLADKAFNAEKWAEAKPHYEKAETIFPEESYPGFQLAEMADKLAELEAEQKKYDAAIAKADADFQKGEWEKSINEYKIALEAKSEEKYPQDKIAEIETILKNEKKVAEDYNEAIAEADVALGEKDYPSAKVGYEKALALKSYENYPKEKLKEIEGILAELEKNEAAYKDAIEEADNLFSAKEYKNSIAAYTKASGLKSEESYPKEKIEEANTLIAEQQQVEEEYKAKIASADAAFIAKDYDVAKSDYEDALGLKTEEEYPKGRINEISELLAASAKLNADYDQAIKEGDNAVSGEDYVTAKSAYEKALTLKANEEYPKTKLKEIAAKIAEAEAAALAKKEQDEKYAALIASADAAFGSEKYEEAKKDYTSAYGLKSEEEYPKNKIAEIDELLAELFKKKLQEQADALAKKELDEKYAALIAAADASFNGTDYEKAETDYRAALSLKSEEAYPAEKIAEIKLKLEELAKQAADEKVKKELDEKYLALISSADAAFGTDNLEKASTDYEAALELKADEQYPKDQLKEIRNKLEELAKNEAEALALKELNEKYDGLIASADGALTSKEYEAAKTDYTAALELKATEQYPKDKLKEIEAALAELARKKAEDEAAELAGKEREDKYKSFVDAGDGAYSGKNYEEALKNYNSALGVKAEEQYPKDKIKEINEVLAEIARQKEEAANAELATKELDAKYTALLAVADKSFNSKSYDEAVRNYEAALEVKSEEEYPKTKIKEIEQILANIAKTKEEDALSAEADRKKREYFDAVVAQADAELLSKNYSEAQNKYKEALGILSAEQYPKDKLKEIETILAKIQAEKDNANLAEKELNDKYNKLIVEADNGLLSKNYSLAQTKYNAALGVKPTEQYPKDKLKEIEGILANLKRQEEEIKVTSNAQKQKKEQYDRLVKLGDEQLATKSYDQAIASYREALGIMPSEAYPKQKIAEIENLLADIAEKDKNESVKLLAEKEKRANYEKLIYDGDRGFRTRDYTLAQAKFSAALTLYPDEKYPKDKLAEIVELLNKKEDAPIVVAVKSNTGTRSKINDDTEKEIEARMAALKNKGNKEKEAELALLKKDYSNQEEIRVSAGIDRTTEADKVGDAYRAKFAKQAEVDAKLTKEKAEDLDAYVNTVAKIEKAMTEKGDEAREGNQKQLEKISRDIVKREKTNSDRAKDMQIDVKKYRADLNKEEEIRVSASIKRISQNKKDIDNLQKEMNKVMAKKQNFYKQNTEELKVFRGKLEKIEQKRIQNAGKLRAANDKVNRKYQEDAEKQAKVKSKRYYKEVKQLDKYKKQLDKEYAVLVKNADKRRAKAQTSLVKEQQAQGAMHGAQDGRYAEFDKKLDIVRKQSEEFDSDLRTRESEKVLLANIEVNNVYRGEKQPKQNSELKSKYPAGITEEVVESGNSITIKRIKITGDQVDVYERVFYTWGGTYYYKNGLNIVKALWDKESIEK